MNIRKTSAGIAIASFSIAALIAGCATDNASKDVQATDLPDNGSSYLCHGRQQDGQESTGHGQFGCYFILHDPATKQILANTPYFIAVYKKADDANPYLTAKGTTDRNGRSVFVRSPTPFSPQTMRFIQMVGTGEASTVPVLVRPTDGSRVPFMNYEIKGCNRSYSGMTDETGVGVMYRCPTQEKVSVSFYRTR